MLATNNLSYLGPALERFPQYLAQPWPPWLNRWGSAALGGQWVEVDGAFCLDLYTWVRQVLLGFLLPCRLLYLLELRSRREFLAARERSEGRPPYVPSAYILTFDESHDNFLVMSCLLIGASTWVGHGNPIAGVF